MVDHMKQLIIMFTSSLKEIVEMDLFHIPNEYNTNQITSEWRELLRNEMKDFGNDIQHNKKGL